MNDPPERMLAIEASTSALSVALFRKNVCLGEEFIADSSNRHAEQLMPMIDRLLRAHHVRPADLNLIGVSRGPGAFTSVRIGLASALGMGAALNIPIVALSTLEVLAAGAADGSSWILPMLDARKGEVYTALYPPSMTADAPPAIPPQVLSAGTCVEKVLERVDASCICIGEGAKVYRREIQDLAGDRIRVEIDSYLHPRAFDLGRRIWAVLETSRPLDPPTPLYLRRPEAVVNLEKKQANSDKK